MGRVERNENNKAEKNGRKGSKKKNVNNFAKKGREVCPRKFSLTVKKNTSFEKISTERVKGGCLRAYNILFQ